MSTQNENGAGPSANTVVGSHVAPQVATASPFQSGEAERDAPINQNATKKTKECLHTELNHGPFAY